MPIITRAYLAESRCEVKSAKASDTLMQRIKYDATPLAKSHNIFYIQPIQLLMHYRLLFLSLFLTACTGTVEKSRGHPSAALTVPDTPLTIHDPAELIGGPAAQGRVGDVLLSNNQVRVIIQKPNKNAGIGSFGGTIIDAYHANKKKGQDQWGELFPMVNVEWTVDYYNYEVLADSSQDGTQVLRAYGMIDAYDYIDLDWIADAASAVLNQQVSFADRFDDRRDPFRVDDSLNRLDPEVVTDYRLEKNARHVEITTTFRNPSDQPIALPVGDFLVAGGALQLLIPGLGFAPPPTHQIGEHTPGAIFAAFPEGDVSYGYFYDPKEFAKSASEADEGGMPFYKTTSLAYAGLTGVLLGEEFLKILPIGSNVQPEIHFVIPAQSERTITRYFIVGDGSAGSVFDAALKILKVTTAMIAGQVLHADGSPVEGAIVAVKRQGGATLVTYRSDVLGQFQGLLPTGEGRTGPTLGNGKYEVWVEKPGFHEYGTARAGSCNPAQVDVSLGLDATVVCTLGESGSVEIPAVIDAETGLATPARLTIVGEDPSPETQGAGTFSDPTVFKKPFGIVDVLLINALGGVGLTTERVIPLEPGDYRFVFSHGPEYAIVERDVSVAAGGTTTLEPVTLQRLVTTPGFVSADFHIHALPSPDSAFSVERRALAAAADGLDVLQSSDHDFLTDYSPVVIRLSEEGILHWDSIQTVVGDEITPNHYGHLHAFPLTVDMNDPDHGALDWSDHPWDEVSPSPDYALSPAEIVERVLADPGEEVIQINHIADNPTGLPVASGWLTTPIYSQDFGVDSFVAYADPIERRLAADVNRPPLPPYGAGSGSLIFDRFTAVELAIGPNMKENVIWNSAIPTWFNLLNLGLLPTATGSSDSHHEIHMPLGMPRSYVAASVDPRDGLGDSFAAIDEEEYAKNINRRQVVVSAGPFIQLTAATPEGAMAGVGEVIRGQQVELDIQVEAPEWAWFDTIEIYMNTEPMPAEDSGRFPLRGEAADPALFAKPYHVPRYVYTPDRTFRLIDSTLTDWSLENGKIQARLKVGISVNVDTWVVVVVKGTRETEGYRSLFPVVPDALRDAARPPASFDPQNIEAFHQDQNVGAFAWAFTNPIFIDVDGDTDHDGFPFEAKWVREGLSNLRPFRQ